MSCEKNLELSGIATGKSKVKTALKAVNHMRTQGKQACLGGFCNGQKCTLVDMEIDVSATEVVTLESGRYQVTVYGRGKCGCTT